MKINWGFRTYLVISIVILIIQLVPYFFMGKWYERTHNYVISPIQDWLDSLDSSILLMICASVIFSFGAALIIMILGWILKLCFKKKKS